MNLVTALRITYVVALVGGVIMIVASTVDFVSGTQGWSAWVSLVLGILFVIFSIWRIINPGPVARDRQ